MKQHMNLRNEDCRDLGLQDENHRWRYYQFTSPPSFLVFVTGGRAQFCRIFAAQRAGESVILVVRLITSLMLLVIAYRKVRYKEPFARCTLFWNFRVDWVTVHERWKKEGGANFFGWCFAIVAGANIQLVSTATCCESSRKYKRRSWSGSWISYLVSMS